MSRTIRVKPGELTTVSSGVRGKSEEPNHLQWSLFTQTDAEYLVNFLKARLVHLDVHYLNNIDITYTEPLRFEGADLQILKREAIDIISALERLHVHAVEIPEIEEKHPIRYGSDRSLAAVIQDSSFALSLDRSGCLVLENVYGKISGKTLTWSDGGYRGDKDQFLQQEKICKTDLFRSVSIGGLDTYGSIPQKILTACDIAIKNHALLEIS